MCGPCSRAWLAWLDYQLPPAPIRLWSGINSVRDIREAQERRYREWRETVRFEQGLIRRLCGEGRHAPERGKG